MKKVEPFIQVGEALHRTPNPEKEAFRQRYNSKYVECQQYESDKLKRNQELVAGLRKILNSQIKEAGND